jgi:hypothetical protein
MGIFSLEVDGQRERPVRLDWKLEDFGDSIQIERSVQMWECLPEIVQIFIPNLAQNSSAINHQMALATRTT